ncbi:MAG: AraC family transcriptional regulator [Rhizorhabdus sp.]|nr:AraC family transcriptional regulator [Rhizorhabdus sp.]
MPPAARQARTPIRSSPLAMGLPSGRSSGIVRAMDQALADIGAVTQEAAWKTAGMSERSFRRAFAAETGTSWQAWLIQARMLTAMSLLAEGRRVTDVAADVGYASLSAFAKAFVRLTGEAPAQYRARVGR